MIEGDPRRKPGEARVENPGRLASDNDVFQHIEGLAASYGFVCFVLLTLPATNQDHLQENLVASNLRTNFVQAYDATRPFKSAPLFARLRETIAPFRWRLEDGGTRPTDGTPGAARLFSDHLLLRGVVVPLCSPEGARAAVLYGGEREPPSRTELARLALDTVMAYDVLCRLRQEPPVSTAKLSDREIQVLGWAANGKTSIEIATILSLSDHTVNSYLNSAMRKMDCVNRTQLVAKALRLHLIS